MSRTMLAGVVGGILAAAGVVTAVQQQVPAPAHESRVFENDRVSVSHLQGQFAGWSEEHSHAGNELVIVLKDFRQVRREGGKETTTNYHAGQVYWISAVGRHDHKLLDPIDLYVVKLK